MADLPYRAEYAKSNRSSCKKCKTNIPMGSFRLAVVFTSSRFDGKMTSWYHFDCFFDRQRPKTAGDIENFDQLRWEDQEKINDKIKALQTGVVEAPPKKSKKKGTSKEPEMTKAGLEFYCVEYAKSGRSTCRGCMEGIAKDEIRISKKNFDSEAALRIGGGIDEWYHTKCFKNNRDELGLVEAVDKVPGFRNLKKEDQKKLLKELPEMKAKKHKGTEDDVDGDGPSGAKRIKKEVTEKDIKKEESKTKATSEDESNKEEMKKQNKIMYKYRDQLESLSKGELQQLLEFNDQQIPSGQANILDHLADVMTFGAIEPCGECKNGQFYYKSGSGYACAGDVSEWTKCTNTTLTPKRKPFRVPKEMAEEYSFLNKYKYVSRQRVIPTLQPTRRPQNEKPVIKTEVKSEPVDKGPPLKGMKFVLGEKLGRSSDDVKKDIEKMGGKIGVKITGNLTALISTKERVEDMDSKMEKAEELGLPVVSLDFIDAVKAGKSGGVHQLVSKMNIASWDCPDLEKRVKEEVSAIVSSKPKSSGSSKGRTDKSLPEKMKLTLKGGGVVDPESGLEDITHVLKTKDALYSVVLGIVDIKSSKNSYYKLQILEDDSEKEWYVFRSWGRVGTTIGDTKLTNYGDKQDAIDEFVFVYEEKTGNAWKNRNKFVKQPGKLYPLDIDYGDSESGSALSAENSTSKLPKSVQELVCMLFDVEIMKRTMMEFELDLTKMPLGKLSQKQLEKAYGLLNQAMKLVESAEKNEVKFLDVSNQFFTLIPHDFGTKTPPLLDNSDLIKSKLEMLESLMEIEVAFSLLKAGDDVKDKDPIDAHYEKLNTKIEVLDKTSEEFALLDTYVKNTHASTHTQYTLQIEEIFKISRQGESKRFKPFSKLPNRKLLWHGSRLANIAGILSQGLRIAPPEAPVTGYMFGKGIYFADMVSKSANYCMTSKRNPVGLMLLCDVALGKSYERKEADYIEKLKREYQSVKGLGKTEPNKEESKTVDGVEIPLGKPVASKVTGTTLLYNEYIVYDIAQVNIKYLLKMKFSYK